jgi:hypothetical protein
VITKEQAMLAGTHGAIFHENSECTTKRVVRWRANGRCKIWKRDLTRWQLPIKFGLYSHGYLTNENAHEYHLEGDCPVDKKLLWDTLDHTCEDGECDSIPCSSILAPRTVCAAREGFQAMGTFGDVNAGL